MSKNNMEYRGLCSTCKHSECGNFPRDPNKPVFYCEEFEVDTCPPVKTTGKDKSPAATSVGHENEDSGKFIGLCNNCDNRRTCVFPKPEGGIWHCEEYR